MPSRLVSWLEEQLFSCKLQGTSITEAGITVSTDRVAEEVILFFRIDSEVGRVCLNLVDQKVCDCLIFYAKEPVSTEVLCFLELKAAGLNEAIKQIINAHRKIKQLLDEKHRLSS